MEDKEFLVKLKELCLNYDFKYGDWPESKYEGMALFGFANDDDSYEYRKAYQTLLKEVE